MLIMATPPIPKHLVRVLFYVDLAGSVGLTTEELDDYAVVRAPHAAYTKAIDDYEWMRDRFTERIEAGPVAGYMKTVGWITESQTHGRWVLSDLGRLLVNRLGGSGPIDEPTEAGAIVLSPEDPMRYELLTRKLADADLLVDPFFKAEQLEWLVQATQIRRILISKGGAADIKRGSPDKVQNSALIQMALGVMAHQDPDFPDIRVTQSVALHDRAVVYRSKPTALLGTSLTGVAIHLSVYVPLPAEASATYSSHLESLWSDALPLPARTQLDPIADEAAEPQTELQGQV